MHHVDVPFMPRAFEGVINPTPPGLVQLQAEAPCAVTHAGDEPVARYVTTSFAHWATDDAWQR